MNTFLGLLFLIVVASSIIRTFKKQGLRYADIITISDQDAYRKALLARIRSDFAGLLNEMTEHEERTGSFSRIQIPPEMQKLATPEASRLFHDVFIRDRQKRALELLLRYSKEDPQKKGGFIGAITTKAAFDWREMQALKQAQAAKNFPVWRRITLGVCGSVDAYRNELRKLPDSTGFVLDDIPVSSTKMDVDLVNISLADLGFKEGAYYHDVCQRIRDVGLKFCAPEVGPALRLDYKDQHDNENLMVLTEDFLGSTDNTAQEMIATATATTIVETNGRKNTFGLSAWGGMLSLFSYYNYPELFYKPDTRIVLCVAHQ